MAMHTPEPADEDQAEPDHAGSLPFWLYGPGWRAGWGQALRDAAPPRPPA